MRPIATRLPVLIQCLCLAMIPSLKKYLEAEDTTFPDPGMIGLWTKADAQTDFDDLTLDN